MGTYAKVLLELESGELKYKPAELELVQNYNTFAVLHGIKNHNNVKPIFDYREVTSPAVNKFAADEDLWIGRWFNLEELDQFNYDQPLQFLEGIPISKSDPDYVHRAAHVIANDTYRSHMLRETELFDWFDRLKAYQPKIKNVYVIYD